MIDTKLVVTVNELLDETAARVVLAVESGDSIRRVSKRLQQPYETVRQAVNRLEDGGFLVYDDGLSVVAERARAAALELVATNVAVSPPSPSAAYVFPQFGDWPFAFARLDAVYVWTHGGFQVARSPDDYPLFVAVRETDLDDWRDFFARFGIHAGLERRSPDAVDGSIQVVLDPRPELSVEHVKGYPVVPRSEAVAYAQENSTQCQSALSMLAEMYDDLELDVGYRERERVGP
jgi:hypothetical protein